MHRFVFHGEEVWLSKLPWTRYTWTQHFLLHAFLQDRIRITFPVVPGMLIFYLFIARPFYIILPTNVFPPVFCGLIVGYVCYDMCHYYVHYGKPTKRSY